MELQSRIERTTMVDTAGQRVEQEIEHRIDPLTGTVASVNGVLGDKARLFLGAVDLEGLRDLEERSRDGCPFCAAREKGTRFAPEFLPEGQLRLGRSVAMPNLFSKCAFDSVVVIDQSGHVLFPSRIAPEALATAVLSAAELVRRARAFDPALVHHAAGMNFLQPGGSSVPHPHLQVHVRGVPYSGVSRLLALGSDWRSRTGRCHWEALLEHERQLGLRHLGSTGPVEWLAAWAPGNQKEVWGLLPGTGSLAEIGEAEAESFARGISRVISFYEESGTHPFTFAFLSSPRPGLGGEFWLQARLCARPAFKPFYANYDSWFGPKFIGDEAHIEAPEAWAARLRANW